MTYIPDDTMISLMVEGFNEDNHKILQSLWKRHLKNRDSKWHFFWEGDYTLIRCQQTFVKRVTGYLRFHGFKVINLEEWVDNIEITEKYQSEFQQIFHAYSEIALKSMNSNITEIKNLFDRVIHCFINNITLPHRREKNGIYFEPWLIAEQAIARAITVGQIIGRRR